MVILFLHSFIIVQVMKSMRLWVHITGSLRYWMPHTEVKDQCVCTVDTIDDHEIDWIIIKLIVDVN